MISTIADFYTFRVSYRIFFAREKQSTLWPYTKYFTEKLGRYDRSIHTITEWGKMNLWDGRGGEGRGGKGVNNPVRHSNPITVDLDPKPLKLNTAFAGIK